MLLTADVDDDRADEAVRVLKEANSIDVDERASEWRSSGWEYAGGTAATGTAFAQFGSDNTNDRAVGAIGTAGAEREKVIPVVEEQLVVGKRDVSRGGVRVRSYVSELPVHEQVRLHDEQINVERRAVDQPLSAADADAFRERTIDMTATGEEAVVGKSARVVEEVVVSKTAEEHVEDVNDSVRRTDVEVDRDSDLDERTTGTTFGGTDRRI